jgi:hypothetical protein
MNVLRRLSRFFLLLLACAPIGTLAAPPQIEQFYADQDRLVRGETVTFTLEGTPRGRASVRIDGISRTIPLKEVDRGVYEGKYTLRRNDALAASNTIRASLRARGLTTSDTLTLAGAAAQPAAPVITRFAVTPISRIEPGGELIFALTGTPRAAASFTIDGVVKDVPMQEVSSGRYEGRYTIRRLDHFPAAVGIVGTLEANGRAVRAGLNQALITDAKPPVIRNLYPRDGETVVAGATSVSATFDDSGGVGVDAKSVRVLIGGMDMTRDAAITPQSFTLRADLRPGTYPVELTASDLAGNTVRQGWKFIVAAQAAAASLPLQILSHANNAEVGGGVTEVRGRTAPDATVDAQVNGTALIAGLFGVTQQLYRQTLRADANGNFGFSFQPQFSVPGARYEVALHATKAELTKDMNLVLFQQK